VSVIVRVPVVEIVKDRKSFQTFLKTTRNMIPVQSSSTHTGVYIDTQGSQKIKPPSSE